ncbi:MAG: hypothetical protein IPO46_08125 [Chitinophagaceae bacterium]|jgi:hypothetical protein|nr:hypothetical protein [Chitinophagaceae bacterium]MBP6047164.1 hypothetical protein [Ferruginibacter sp.]MBK7088687.1 hypothetical protein [Chitinophagaceae bacterium]MBK7345743.1 hypothetical protein [Chitinophagaceae bacterium]MBK8929896.1 hypothetical protein [Chitinophagaceae bacterium]
MKYPLIIILLCLLVGCQSKSSGLFYEIVNSNFINFTDTTAYHYGTFFPAPKDTPRYTSSSKEEFKVLVDTFFINSDKPVRSLIVELGNKGLTEFIDVVKKPQDNKQYTTINLEKVSNTGRYSLTGTANVDIIDNDFVGAISFGKPYVLKKKAIIIASIASSPKAGRMVAFLLENKQDNWIIQDKIVLERW